MDTALSTSQWQTFTGLYWKVEPVRFEYAPEGMKGPVLRVVCYRNRKGRLMLPPYQPHLPLYFMPTETETIGLMQREWLDLGSLFADDIIAHGIRGGLTFSPAITDPRPWAWSWFHVLPRFTDFIDFPFELGQTDRVVRQHANKARRGGFTCIRTDNLRHAFACLAGSEKRKNFSYGITLGGLEMAHDLLGPDAFRVYVCYAPNGEPATARIVLHRPSGRACDWMAGTIDTYLHSGATQLLIAYMMNDLQEADAVGYNSCGANTETVVHAKTMWGGRLMTQYRIEAYAFSTMKHLMGNMLRYRRQRIEVTRNKAARGRAEKCRNGLYSRQEGNHRSETKDVELYQKGT